MDVKARNITPSGIEPVDKLMGGLEMGQLYLVHGEASGKSLFGIKFLIEGLKRGENGALVIRYSPEDAVRRFARLGYDCLEDVYSGRLVILEYSDDIIQQIARLRQLTPVLRELEWLLGETRPERLIFDPVTNLVVGESGNLDPRVREFAEWARSFGATVVFIANADKEEVVESFRPLVAESFRFEMKENGERATRFMAFEKTAAIPDQAIEVDPSRGVFLLGRAQTPEHFFSVFSAPPPSDTGLKESRVEARESENAQSTATSSNDERAGAKGPLADYDFDKILEPLTRIQSIDGAEINSSPQAVHPASSYNAQVDRSASNEPVEQDITSREITTSRLDRNIKPDSVSGSIESSSSFDASKASQQSRLNETTTDVFSDLFDELSLVASPLEPDNPEPKPSPSHQSFSSHLESRDKVAESFSSNPAQHAASGYHQSPVAASPVAEGATEAQPGRASDDRDATQPRRRTRASDQKIDSAIAARAVELLLRPPESEMLTSPSLLEMPCESRSAAQATALDVPVNVQPKDFNVLIIDDDPNSSDLIAQTLTEYTVEVVHDGVSGLAKLIAFKPDLVVLNVDLPIIDGFKVLEHIRLSLNMPIIIVSGSRVRASDRLLAAELGADYYLTKPFSVKELRHKARQLIARYRGISSWIINARMATNESAPQADHSEQDSVRLIEPLIVSIGSEGDQFTPYKDFAAQVEKRVKAAIETGAAFSVVGCRLPAMTAKGGQVALALFELVRTLVRDTDLISTNPRNDLVVLLASADTSGARAFASRLRERATEEMHQEPSIWMRSFPDLEEATEVTASAVKPANGNKRNRRSSDARNEADKAQLQYPARVASSQTNEQGAQRTAARREITTKPDTRESYIDFLEHL
jgi:CheY-like chemotaxis protein/KaiC/GvpD/RAD55 family RecA-like ATPase